MHTSQNNFRLENQLILLIVTDGKKRHYLALKKLSVLLTGIILNHVGDFYRLSCFHLYSTENKLKKHEKVRNDHDYCYLEMPKEDNKMIKYNYGEKPLKAPFVIYGDLECLLEQCIHAKIDLKDLMQKKIKN